MSKLLFLIDTGLGFIDRPINGLINWVMKMVMFLWFMIQSVIAQVLDLLTQLFFIFAGMTPVSSTTEFDPATGEALETDVVHFFLTKDVFRDAYLSLSLVALGLVVVFTIAKIIKQDYFEKAGPRSKGPIFRNVALSFIAFLCVIPIFYFVIGAASALALLVMKALGYEGGGIGTMIFNMSWSDGGKSFIRLGEEMPGSSMRDDNFFGWYDLNTFYEYFWDPTIGNMKAERDATYYWWIFLLTGLVLIANLFKMLLAMITRMFKLIALFIVAPSPISQIVLDDGAKFKSWKDKVIQEAVKVVGCVMSFMIFLLIAGAVNDLDLARFAFSPEAATAKSLIDSNTISSEIGDEINVLYYGNAAEPGVVDAIINALCKAFLLIAGVGAIQDIDSTITPLLAGGSSSMDLGATGKSLQGSISTMAKGALDVTKTGVGLAAGAAGAVASGAGKLAGGVNSLASKFGEMRDNRKAAKMAGGSSGEESGGSADERAETPETSSPTQPGAPETPDTPETSSPTPPEGEGTGADDKATEPETPKDSREEIEGKDRGSESAENPGDKKAEKAEKKAEKIANKIVNKDKKKADNAKKTVRKIARGVASVGKGVGKRIGKAGRIGGMVVSTGVKAGWKTSAIAGKAAKALLNATGLSAVADVGEQAVGAVGGVTGQIAGSYKKVKESFKATGEKIADNKKKAADRKEALLKQAKDVVAKKNTSTDAGSQKTAAPIANGAEFNENIQNASVQQANAVRAGNDSAEVNELSMDGYDEVESVNNAHIAAEENMMAAQDSYDKAVDKVSEIKKEVAELEGNKAFTSKAGRQYFEVAEGYRASMAAGENEAAAEYKKQLESMNANKKYSAAAAAYYGTTSSGEVNYFDKDKSVENGYSYKRKELTSAEDAVVAKENALQTATEREQEARTKRDESFGGATAAVRAKIEASNLTRMTKLRDNAQKDPSRRSRIAYAKAQVAERNESARKANERYGKFISQVAKQNDEIAQSTGFANFAEMVEKEGYSVAGVTLDSALDSANTMMETYDSASSLGNMSEDVAQLDSSGYEEIQQKRKEYKEKSGAWSEAFSELVALRRSGASADEIAISAEKEKRLQKECDDAFIDLTNANENKTIATKYRLAVDDYSAKYQEYQQAISEGNVTKIQETKAAYYDAKRNLESSQSEVDEVVVRVSFANRASGGTARQRASRPPVSEPTSAPTVPYRSDVGGSLMSSIRSGKAKEVAIKILRSNDRGEISDDLAETALMMYSDKPGSVYADGRTIDTMMGRLPDTYDGEVAELEKTLDSITSVPSKAYYRKNGIDTVDAYRRDITDRYTSAKNGYEEAMKLVRENFAKYKVDSSNVEALSAAKEAMSRVISHSANMNNIRMEIEKK